MVPSGEGRAVLAPVTNNVVNRPQAAVKPASMVHEVSEPSESTEDTFSENECEGAPYPSTVLSSAKKAEIENRMQEEDMII